MSSQLDDGDEHSYARGIKRKLGEDVPIASGSSSMKTHTAVRVRAYQDGWSKEFPWLECLQGENGRQCLHCKLCRTAKMKNIFATTGACECH